jgi:hypothetical protein
MTGKREKWSAEKWVQNLVHKEVMLVEKQAGIGMCATVVVVEEKLGVTEIVQR